MPARRSVSRGTRRKLVWARHVEEQFSLVGGTFNALNLLQSFETAYGANLIGCTAVRLRIRWAPFSGVTAGQPVAAMAVRVADEADIVSSAPADPLGPLSDAHADWMAWDTCIASLAYGAGGNDQPGPEMSRYIDVRAMRKIDELGQGLYMFFESTAGAPDTMTFNVSTSVLIALP